MHWKRRSRRGGTTRGRTRGIVVDAEAVPVLALCGGLAVVVVVCGDAFARVLVSQAGLRVILKSLGCLR